MTFSIRLRVVGAAACVLWLAGCGGGGYGPAPVTCFVVRGDEAAAAVGAGDTFQLCQRRSTQPGGPGWHLVVEGTNNQTGSALRRSTLVLDYPTADVVPISVTQSTPYGTTGVRVQVGYGAYSDDATKTLWSWGCGNSSTNSIGWGTFQLSVTSVDPVGPRVHGTVHAVCPTGIAPDGYTDVAAGKVTIDGTF